MITSLHRTALILCAVVFTQLARAQLLDAIALDTVHTYHSLERALHEPDKVFRLELSGDKLKEVPEDLKRLKNLNALDLGNNKIRTLPAWFADLAYLQELRVTRNKLVEFPVVICKLKRLKRLDLSRNALTGLPKCIGGLRELVSLDLWDNDLADFPEEIEGMEALRFMDLRNIQFEQPEMDRIQELLPRAKVHFSPPCNCGM